VGRNRRAARVGCGAGKRAQVPESGRGGVAGEAERSVRRKEKKMTGRPGVSERRERGGQLLAWAGASTRPRREGGKREGWRTQAFGPGKGEVARSCAGD
jgi:hypothetical protein